jgi:RHS repeat-associated protein
MYDEKGEKIWETELDIYGKVRIFAGRSLSDCPFRYQGQYEDIETGLYYNRFRYYDPSSGNYLSQDPIGLQGGMRLYGYVHDPNNWIDVFGLTGIIYLRTDPYTGKQYVGKSKSPEAFARRQQAHNSALKKANPDGGQKYDFVKLQENVQGKQNLSLAEENWIRDKGGIAKDGGSENKIHAMSDENYKNAGGTKKKVKCG